MSNSFCRFLSNGAKFNVVNNNLVWKPCCNFTKGTVVSDSANLAAELLRTRSINNWSPDCSICWQKEAAGVKSLRQASFTRVPEDFPDGHWIDLEISIDTDCNAACTMCSPAFSSTWAKFKNNNNLGPVNIPDPNSAKKHLDQIINKFPLHQVRSVFILGGEPFFSTTHKELLNHIRKVHQSLDQVHLMYSTNGSIFPDGETLELWKFFKKVTVCLSIDAVGDRFEYLRWPIKWNTITKTVNRFLDETDVILDVVCTANPLNAHYIQEVQDWTGKSIPLNRIKSESIRLHSTYGLLDLSNTPISYRSLFDRESDLGKLLLAMPVNHKLPEMIRYLDQLDSIRKLNWRDTFPDVVKYLE